MNKFQRFYRMYLPLPIIAAKRSARDVAIATQYITELRPLIGEAEHILGQVLMTDDGAPDSNQAPLPHLMLFKWVSERAHVIRNASKPLKGARVWCKYRQTVMDRQMETLEVLLQGLERLCTLYLGNKNHIEESELVQLIDIMGLTLLRDALEADNRRIQAYIQLSQDTHPKRHEQEAQMAINNCNIRILSAYSDALAGKFEGLRSIADGEQHDLAHAEQCIRTAADRIEPFYERMEHLARRRGLKEQIKIALDNFAASRVEMTQSIQLASEAVSLQRSWLASKRNQLTSMASKEEARGQLKYISQQLYQLGFRRTVLAENILKVAKDSIERLREVY